MRKYLALIVTAFLVIFLVECGNSSVLPGDETLSSVKANEILAEVVKAHGGLENLGAVRTIVTVGKVSVNSSAGLIEMDMRQYRVLPDKVRTDMTSKTTGEISQIFDGESAWMITAQGTRTFPKSQVEKSKREAFRVTIQLLTQLSSNDLSFRHLGEEAVEGKTTDVIQVSNATSGELLRVSIDQETRYIIKKAYKAISAEGRPVNMEEFINDYRDVSGVKYGFHTVVYRNGEQSAEFTLSEVAINAEVDESLFRK
jgi:outer membrane lipoprotein-sorting protein